MTSTFETMGETDAALDELAAWAREYPDPIMRRYAHLYVKSILKGRTDGRPARKPFYLDAYKEEEVKTEAVD
jgi:hypothetical protein